MALSQVMAGVATAHVSPDLGAGKACEQVARG
jgi:hypothetical protein